MEFDGKVYLDATLAFGWNAAPGFFSLFSYGIQDWQRKQGDTVLTYIDDFFGIEPSFPRATQSKNRWVSVLDVLGLADKISKRRGPVQVIPFLGYEWDSVVMEVRLPEDKCEALLALAQGFVGRRWASVREVQHLAGKMCFAAQILRGGWVHIRRIWDSFKGCADKSANQRIFLNRGFQSDVSFWLQFLPEWNGISTLISPASVFIGTDACKFGYGALWDYRWLAGAWSEVSVKKRHSNWKELTAVLLAVRLWGHLWRNCVVNIVSDNSATVGIINRGYSPCREYMRIARKLFWLAVRGGFEIRATWIPGSSNSIPDALSRWLTSPSSSISGGPCEPKGLVFPGSKERVYKEDLCNWSASIRQFCGQVQLPSSQ